MRSTMPLLVAFALTSVGCPGAEKDGPVVVVTASYPGSNAELLADTVAAPIEQQIIGTEKMVRVESESRNDGSYIARLRFDPNTDPDTAVLLIQNRVALANPVLPEAVQRVGVAVKVRAAEKGDKNRVTIALVDRRALGREALRGLSDAVLKRLSADGVIVNPEVFPGPDENQTYVDIDRAKCREHGVTPAEVLRALQVAGPGEKIEALKTVKIETLKALPVTSAKGDKISLGTVAAIKVVKGPAAIYRVDMYPAVRVTGSPPEGKTAAAASRCTGLADTERKSHNDADGFAVVNLTAR